MAMTSSTSGHDMSVEGRLGVSERQCQLALYVPYLCDAPISEASPDFKLLNQPLSSKQQCNRSCPGSNFQSPGINSNIRQCTQCTKLPHVSFSLDPTLG